MDTIVGTLYSGRVGLMFFILVIIVLKKINLRCIEVTPGSFGESSAICSEKISKIIQYHHTGCPAE